MKKTPVIVARAIVAFAVIATGTSLLSLGCHHTQPPPGAPAPGPQSAVTPPTVAPETGNDNTGASVRPPKGGGVIYTVSAKGGDDNDLAPQHVNISHSASPARDAVKELIRARKSPIPAGTTLRGIKIQDGLATVDFSDAFQANFHGSDTEEAQTINSLLLTLGQFPSIERVQILVEGKPIDALSQLSIAEPLPVLRPPTSLAVRTTSDAQ